MVTFLLGLAAVAVAVLLFLFGANIDFTPRPTRGRNGEVIREAIHPHTRDLISGVMGRSVPMVLSGLGLVLIANSVFTEVPAGHQGIVLSFKAASDQTLSPGLGFKYPWQSVKPISTRAEAWTQKFECQSKDLQKIGVEMTLVYRRSIDDVANVYKRVREQSAEIDVKPGGRETLKASVAQFDAANLIQNRPDLAKSVTAGMEQWINPKGLEMMRCSIANVDFEESYDDRVEAKVIALEKARQTQNELIMQETMAEITKMAASGLKEAAKESARGDNESRQIVAEANAYKTEVVASAEAYSRAVLGTAEAERMVWLAKALGDSRAALTLEAITKWNGDVPNFAMEGDAPTLPFEFLQSPEPLQEYDSPIVELEAALVKHQELMAEEAVAREAEEVKVEAERIKREKEDSRILSEG